MASEYLRWKFRDVRPDPPLVLTPRQKLRNWWDYHKWHVALAVVLGAVALDLGRSMLGIGQVRPDYQIAYVGAAALPEQTAQALEDALAALGEDCNGDGRVVVQLHQYVATGTMDENAEYTYANQVTLMADLEACDSCLFLLENAETFHRNYQVLADASGSLSATEEAVCSYAWADCPVLAGLELGDYTQTILGQEQTGSSQALLGGLRVARRGYWQDRTCEHPEACDALWRALTKGATT